MPKWVFVPPFVRLSSPSFLSHLLRRLCPKVVYLGSAGLGFAQILTLVFWTTVYKTRNLKLRHLGEFRKCLLEEFDVNKVDVFRFFDSSYHYYRLLTLLQRGEYQS